MLLSLPLSTIVCSISRSVQFIVDILWSALNSLKQRQRRQTTTRDTAAASIDLVMEQTALRLELTLERGQHYVLMIEVPQVVGYRFYNSGHCACPWKSESRAQGGPRIFLGVCPTTSRVVACL